MSDKIWPTEEQAREALKNGTGEGVKIAVIDSGVCVTHPDLAGLKLLDDVIIEQNEDKIETREGNGEDVFGHGTAIAYLIKEVAPQAQIGSFRVMNARLGSRNDIIRAGVRAAIDRGYHILNCSFGCKDVDGRHVMKYKDWVDRAYLRQVHIVTACNNNNYAIPEWPGYFPTCINVNMARTEDTASFFYRKDHLVEFAAAGVDVTVPWIGDSHKKVVGSSYSAPRIAGHLARLLSRFPNLSVPQGKSLLQYLGSEWSRDLAHVNVLH